MKIPYSARRFCSLFQTLTLLSSPLAFSQVLTWDPNGGTAPNPSDGEGNWNGTGLWWDGAANVDWSDGNIAAFGSGPTGLAGTVNLQGETYNVSELRFNEIDYGAGNATDGKLAYTLTNGTINLGASGSITLNNRSSASQTEDRIVLNNSLSGSNVTISNSDTAAFLRLGGTNTWTGSLTFNSVSSGQFIEIMNTAAISSLSTISTGNNTTLALNAPVPSPTDPVIYSGPAIHIQGTGSANRGALRFDTARSIVQNQIILNANATIGTGNSASARAHISGDISGAFNLSINSNQANLGTIILESENNTFNDLSVNKGNLQVGHGDVGSSGNGLVTANGDGVVISGTGTIRNGLTVSNGMVKPGDYSTIAGVGAFGDELGHLRVEGPLTFNPTVAMQVAEFQLGIGISDRIQVNGPLILNEFSDIYVTLTGLYMTNIALDDTFDLITYTGELTQNGFSVGSGSGDTGNLILPDISFRDPSWSWIATLGDGALTITVVPEPSSLALFGAAGSLLALRRRRTPQPI